MKRIGIGGLYVPETAAEVPPVDVENAAIASAVRRVVTRHVARLVDAELSRLREALALQYAEQLGKLSKRIAALERKRRAAPAAKRRRTR